MDSKRQPQMPAMSAESFSWDRRPSIVLPTRPRQQTTPFDSPPPRTTPLVINAGDNLELDQFDVTLPYQHVKMLGHGGCASVEMVRDVNTGSVYARKVFKHVTQRSLKAAKQELRNEVQIMQRLSSHRHIIRVHATYIMNRDLGILLSPVADGGDLQSFLQDYHDNKYSKESEQTGILIRAFGCLASGLAFIHQKTIRHKDIKPSNILIHRGRILYTDFGISYDFSSTGQGTTTGLSAGHTKRYCAPEVAALRPRNAKSDIFSLGCVFLELDEAINGGFPDLLFNNNFYETLEMYPENELWAGGWGEGALRDLTMAMVQIDPTRRPTARGVTSYLHLWDPPKFEFFCRHCRDDPALEDISLNSSSPLPPQSASEPLWRLVNDSIRECTKHVFLRDTVTPRQMAQWVADNHLEFLLRQRSLAVDWIGFYEGDYDFDGLPPWRQDDESTEDEDVSE